MKRTDIERKQRELRRSMKKEMGADEKMSTRDPKSAGAYIKKLTELFRHDTEKIYNILNDEDILETVLEMKEDLPEKKWEDVFKKAIRNTKIQEKELAMSELKQILE